jgi:ACS family hexuronate transporter-like MFS transporter
VICGLLFFATTICYIDRQVIGILKQDVLMNKLAWTEIDYANVIFAFQAAYALGQLLSGRLFDRIGVRLGLALAVGMWSMAAIAHGLVGLLPPELGITIPVPFGLGQGHVFVLASVLGFGAARVGLGFAEGGNFPAAVKAVSEWHPRRERALATGLFNAGSNMGALITPIVVPWLSLTLGWPAAFYATGVIGLVWLVFWLPMYNSPERHPRVSAGELAYIQSDPPDPAVKISWLQLLGYRQTWAFVIGMAMSAPIWWFYLYWIPGFLQKSHSLKMEDLPLPLVVIYLMTDAGSIGGGWISSALLKRGWSVNAARKTAFLICALCVVPVFAASQVSGLWTGTLLIGLAASAHQGFSANLFTLVSDTVPRQAVSSVVGLGGTAGALAGMLFAKLVGYVLDASPQGGYTVLFGIAASAYLLNLLVIHTMLPRLEPMRFAEKA